MRLAQIVARAGIGRLALLGLAKNVGKTTTTMHLMATLLAAGLYRPQELALTSLGLDGEAYDALTGLPKPRYRPQAGVLVLTAASLLARAEAAGARFQRLQPLAGRTALGPVWLARVLQTGEVVIAGPTLLRDLRQALALLPGMGVRLALVDGAIDRLGTAAPGLTDACILCTGASAAPSVELVARRTAEIVRRFSVPQTMLTVPGGRGRLSRVRGGTAEEYTGPRDLTSEAAWLAQRLADGGACVLRAALTEELAGELQRHLASYRGRGNMELIVEDATKIFCQSATLRHLADCGLQTRVITPMRLLAITINPATPAYPCTTRELLEALHRALPAGAAPVLDVRAEKD